MHRFSWFFGLLVALLATAAWSDEIAVVAGKNAPVSQLGRLEVVDLFLGLGQPIPGLRPFDQADPILRERFYRALADRSMASVRAHWAKQVFTGRGHPPPTLAAGATEKTLQEHADAVTYVPAERVPSTSKVLLLLDNGERK